MLDTNICIYLMKHQPPEVARRLAKCNVGEVVMSAITYAELEYGVAVSGDNSARNRRALAALIKDIPVLPFDERAGADYGHIRFATREKKSDALDKLIAAHAKSVHAVLVTNNEKDFAVYPGLKIENWVSA